MNAAVTTSLAERIADLGGISVDRVRTEPPPGTASVDDLIRVNDSQLGRCELVDNTLVEKTKGWRESLIAAVLLHWLKSYLDSHNAGIVTGEDGMTMLYPGVVRGPDIAFVSWSTLPGGKIPDESVPEIAPDFVIEILSRGNTRAEMARKHREYFQGGVKLVWMVDLRSQTIAVYTSPEKVRVVDEDTAIDGGPVLSKWTFQVGDLFAELDRKAPPAT